MEQIHLLHTNDIHSHLENWPKIRSFLLERQQQYVNDLVLTIDVGDFCDRWHPLTEATSGLANTELLNEANYDLVTIGNNEGLGFSHEQLNQLYQEAHFKVVLTNVFDQKTQRCPNWCVDKAIIETKAQTKIAFLGLTACFKEGYAANSWEIKDGLDCLKDCLEEVKQSADIIILLSHLGILLDRQIAAEFPEIAVIIGGHTHHLLMDGEVVNQTLLTAAHKYGNYVGEITLTIDQHKIVNQKAQCYAVDSLLAPDKNEWQINQYSQMGKKALQQQKVANLLHSLSINPPFTSANSMMQAFQQCLLSVTQCEVSLFNTGLFCQELSSGVITREDLHQCLPHLMHLVRVKLTGENLIRLAGEIEKNSAFLRYYHPKGLGFRGEKFGQIISNGLTYDVKSKQAYLNQQPIIKKNTYVVVTLDYFVYLPFFPTLELTGQIELLYPQLIREVFAEYLAKKYPLN